MGVCDDFDDFEANATIGHIISHMLHRLHNCTMLRNSTAHLLNNNTRVIIREDSTVTNILLDMFTVLALTIILTNSGLIAAIVSQKPVRLRPFNVLLVSLAVAHVLTGMCTIIYVGYFFNAEDTNPSEPWCRVSEFLINFPLFQVRLGLIMVGVERMIHLVRPSCLEVVKRFPVAVAMLVVPWIFGFGITLGLRAATGSWHSEARWCYIFRGNALDLAWACINFVIPALLLLLSVAVMTGFLVFTRCSTRVRFPAIQALDQSSTSALRETRLTVIAVMSITILWIILNLPSTLLDAGAIECDYSGGIQSCGNLFKLFIQLPFIHATATPLILLLCPDVRRPLCAPCRESGTAETAPIDNNESHPLHEIEL